MIRKLGLTPDMLVLHVEGEELKPFSLATVPDKDFKEVKDGIDFMKSEAASGNREASYAGITSLEVEDGIVVKPSREYRVVYQGSAMASQVALPD